MATRLYPRRGDVALYGAPVRTALQGEWLVWTQGSPYLRLLGQTPEEASRVGTTEDVRASGSGVAMALALVTAPLNVAQTVAGTVTAQVRARESSSSAQHWPQIKVAVVSASGALRGWAYGANAPSSLYAAELQTAATNTSFPAEGPGVLTPVDGLPGDRIVVMLGVNQYSTATYTAYLNAWDVADVDLPVDRVTTTIGNPWIEFSQDLTFDEASASDVVTLEYPHDDLRMDRVGDTRSTYGETGGASVPAAGQMWPR